MAKTMNLNSAVEDKELKRVKLCFDVKIVAHATAASKSHYSDLPGVAVLATEGKTADVVALEATFTSQTNYAAPNDANGLFSVLISAAQIGTIRKVLQCTVFEKSATGMAAPTGVKLLGTVPTFVTTAGNVIVGIDSATNFSTTDAHFNIDLDIEVAK